MKKILLFFFVFVLGFDLFGQPTIKVFAFEQENVPGTKHTRVTDENGKPVGKAAAQKNYFIFLSFRKTYSITPVQVFIRGKAFSIRSTANKKTPVEYVSTTVPNNPEKTTLVPLTANKVLEIKVKDAIKPEKKNSYLQHLTGKNDVVIAYLWHKKKYFATLQEIKRLEPVANE